VADGIDGEAAIEMHRRLSAQGAVPRFVGIKLGPVQSEGGDSIQVEVSMEAMPSVLWDGMIVPDGSGATAALSKSGHALEFLKDQYRHCKSILLVGPARELLAKAGIPSELETGEADAGLLQYEASKTTEAVEAFAAALAQHRHFARETDPPRV
jgi:catalase